MCTPARSGQGVAVTTRCPGDKEIVRERLILCCGSMARALCGGSRSYKLLYQRHSKRSWLRLTLLRRWQAAAPRQPLMATQLHKEPVMALAIDSTASGASCREHDIQESMKMRLSRLSANLIVSIILSCA